MIDSPSSANRMSSASSPYIVKGSSWLPSASVSNISTGSPSAAMPRSVKGLSLSKEPNPARFSVPPLGACGFT